MIFEEHIGTSLRGVAVAREGERISHTLISIDAHTTAHTALREATLEAYTHLLITGCGKYSKQEFFDALLLLGANLTVQVSADRLHISLSVLEENHAKAFALLSCMLKEPSLSQKELARVKTLMLNTLKEDREDAKSRSYDAFANVVTSPDHRVQTASLDAVALAIPKITRSLIQQVHKELMSDLWIFTLVCDSAQRAQRIHALENLRGTFKDHSPQILAVSTLNPVQQIITINIPSKENIEVNIGCPLPFTLAHQDYAAFWFGVNVLGKWGGFAGRLMSTVREKEGLTYGIYAKMEGITQHEQGFLRIMSFFAPTKVEQGITSILREIKAISEHGITKEEYTRFMNISQTGQILLQDSILKIASDIHGYLVRGLSVSAMHAHKSELLTVTHSEVNTALATYLDATKLSGAFAGPTSSKEKEIRALLPVAKARK